MSSPDVTVPQLCGNPGCTNECMIVNRGEPDENRPCLDCYLRDQAKEILSKALQEIYDLGFDTYVKDGWSSQADGNLVTMLNVSMDRARFPCPYYHWPFDKVPPSYADKCCPVCKSTDDDVHLNVEREVREKHDKAIAAGHEICVVCKRLAPLKDGECPDCRH